MRLRNSLASLCNLGAARGLRLFESHLRAAMALAALLVSTHCSYAVSERAREACKADYYQHCSQYSVGTEELRQCMRKVGEGLSTPCLAALAQDGEITKADVERYHASHKEGAKASNPQGTRKAPDIASTKPDDRNVASAGKVGKKKADKATKVVGAANLKSVVDTSKTSKASKIASTEKSGKKQKISKEASGNENGGKKTRRATNGKEVKSFGTAKKNQVIAKAEESGGTGKVKKAAKTKQAATTKKSDKVKIAQKAEKSGKVKNAAKAEKTAKVKKAEKTKTAGKVANNVKKADKAKKADKVKVASKAAKTASAKTAAKADKNSAKANTTSAKATKSAKLNPTKKVKKPSEAEAN